MYLGYFLLRAAMRTRVFEAFGIAAFNSPLIGPFIPLTPILMCVSKTV